MQITWINASAGTGKTKALVDHCLDLLNKGVKPENILCITFTNVAVSEMKQRVQNDAVIIKTLHSVAQSIVQKIRNIQITHVLDSSDQELLLRRASHEYFLKNPKAAETLSLEYSYEYFLKLLLKVVSKTKTKVSTVDFPTTPPSPFKSLLHKHIENETEYFSLYLTQKNTIRQKLKEEVRAEAENVYTYVQNLKIYEWMKKNITLLEHINGVIEIYQSIKTGYDFNDLILDAIYLLEDPTNLFEATKSFQYILLDEAQDTSFHQWQLFQKIVENAAHALIVGDNKQNIYSFQDARPEFFDNFKERMKSRCVFEEKTLSTNYRSLKAIVDWASDQCKSLTPPKQEVFRKDSGHVHTAPNTKHILELLKSGIILPSTGLPIRPQDIILLFRKRDDLFDRTVKMLEDHHIPVDIETKYLFQDEPVIKELMALINLHIYGVCDAYSLFLYNHSSLKEAGIGCHFCTVENLCAALLDVLPLHLWEILVDILSKIPSPTFYLLREYLHSHTIYFRKPRLEHAVWIMTIHGSKGLAAPIVYLIETNQNTPYEPFMYDITTNSICLMPPSDIYHPAVTALREHTQTILNAENDRLLYVAITRARDHFYHVPYKKGKGLN